MLALQPKIFMLPARQTNKNSRFRDGKIRRDNVFLKDGRFIPLIFHGGLCTFVRESLSKDERLYVGVNLTDKPFDMSFVDSSKVLYTSEPQKVKKLVPNGSIILK